MPVERRLEAVRCACVRDVSWRAMVIGFECQGPRAPTSCIESLPCSRQEEQKRCEGAKSTGACEVTVLARGEDVKIQGTTRVQMQPPSRNMSSHACTDSKGSLGSKQLHHNQRGEEASQLG